MIAMGLMNHPRLIIADEPTTALDVTVQRQVLQLLAGVRRDTDAAILLISHDIAVVAQTCDPRAGDVRGTDRRGPARSEPAHRRPAPVHPRPASRSCPSSTPTATSPSK